MSKKITVRTILVFFLFGTCFLATSSVQLSSLNGNESTGKAPKASGYWDLTGSLIVIDNNWSATASSYGWCHYNGTHYIIENVTLDALGSGGGIIIKNSNDFFEIRNCTIYNATELAWPWSAILMDTVSNGRVIHNNLSNNNIGVYSLNCNDLIISHNVMEKLQDSGIYSEFSDTIVISHNNISRTVIGIWTGSDLNDRITENWIQTCHYGIYTYRSNFTHVIGNMFYNMTNDGIRVVWVHSNFISENDVSTCDRREIAVRGRNNNVTSNTIVDADNGIKVDGPSYFIGQNNLIIDNVIMDGDIGIHMDTTTANNSIYLNEMINNARNAVDSNYFTNDWDNGSIGNYYSDYAGKDVDDDGIGDTPRNITAQNLVDVNGIDNFPIWWDHPLFSISSPVDDQVFQETAPSFSISITEGVSITMWYTLNDGPKNYITTTSGTINQTAWNALSNGDVFIRFYVSDARDWTNPEVVRVIKNVPEPPPSYGDEEPISDMTCY